MKPQTSKCLRWRPSWFFVRQDFWPKNVDVPPYSGILATPLLWCNVNIYKYLKIWKLWFTYMPTNQPSGNNHIVEPVILVSNRRGVVVALQADADRGCSKELQKIRCVVRIAESRSHDRCQWQNAERHVASGVRRDVVPTEKEIKQFRNSSRLPVRFQSL